MIRSEYIEAHRYEIMGLMVEAAIRGKDGMALFMANTFTRIDAMLGKAWDAAQPNHLETPVLLPTPEPPKPTTPPPRPGQHPRR